MAALIWRVKPHNDRTFSATEKEGSIKVVGGIFTAVLVNVSNESTNNNGGTVADLTSTLTAPTMAIRNGTIVTCHTVHDIHKQEDGLNSSNILIFAGGVG